MTKLLMISGDRSLATGKRGAFAEMLEEFAKHFERIDIISPHSKFQKLNSKAYPVNVYVHSSPHGLWYQPFFIAKKGKELFDLNHHDVVTVHEYPPFYNGIGTRLLKRRIGIPAVLEIHHIVGWPRASSVSEVIGRILSRLFLSAHTKKFDAVRVVNATVKSVIAAWGVSAEKISIVPSVYLDHTLIAEAKNQPKRYDLVFAARLTHNKGLLSVIDALPLIPDATLLVVGDGSLRSAAEGRAKSLGVDDRITFAGWLPTALDTAKAIASGRLFVMNSKSEGNPRVGIEAMALGVPVLATRVGIMPDVITDGVNGTFTDGTAEAIALMAQALLADPAKLTSMGGEATKIAGRFEKKAAIKKYAEFLKNM